MSHEWTGNKSTIVDISLVESQEVPDAPNVRRQRNELVRRAHRMFGTQLAEAILTQDPVPKNLVGLSNRASGLPYRALAPLKDALDVAEILNTVVGPPTIQAWFIGLNPELDDRVPAEVIVTDPEAVMVAARRFVANG